MNDIIKILNNCKKIDAWKTVNVNIDSYQLFCVHNKIETVRRVISDETKVTVYVNHDEKTGSSTFTVFPSDSETEIAAKLDNASNAAKLIYDTPYGLPKKEHSVVSCVRDESIDPVVLAADVYEAVQRGNDFYDCDVNALEIFIDSVKTRVINSEGLDKFRTKHNIMIEAIPTCNKGGESVELYKTISLATVDTDKITAEINESIADVSARMKAVRPKEKINCPVIFRANELKDLIAELIADSNFKTVYSGGNLHKIGDKWNNGGLCPITVTLRGALQDCSGESSFDVDGVNYVDVTVIENGEIKACHGSHRFAFYLGKEATGSEPCVEIAAGNLTKTELFSGKYLEIASMSGLQVDVYNDYIGGEIRLAYYSDGTEVVPVTGISVSGKLSETLGTFQLSDMRTTLEKFCGPCYCKAEKLTIY